VRCGQRHSPASTVFVDDDDAAAVCDVQLKSPHSVEVHLGRSYTNQQ